ncbi:WD40-like Beta Propeller Repeat [Paractinoplanes atraurantiacus]|uniref:WD40-like Beta Propeller Repeat n=2 Tax=Paractinoplanes atraurantiacus TaxID=1036182 RepID=A0A285JKY3_9ACTN|nr:WD40-like Beta Propeller Repeat [Actinoplanes atraurantiacus]
MLSVYSAAEVRRGAFVMGAFGRVVGLAMAGVAAGTLVQPAVARANEVAATAGASAAGTMSLPSLVAYVRGGDIYVSKGGSEKRLTSGGDQARPRWAPDGKQIAYLKGGLLWVMRADGSGQRRLTTRPAAGPSWSPDGKWIAFSSLSCSGGPGVYRIAVKAKAQPEVLFPRDCRGEDLPAEPAPVTSRAGSLSERLAADDAVAWSPDGKQVAFRGGSCESVYDACLSVGTVATGGEQTVAAYGGGSLQNRGFAVVPSWRQDGKKLAWTAYQEGETQAQNEPVHLVEYDTTTRAKRTVGGAGDREMAYVDKARAVATGQNAGGSWVMVVGLSDGTRKPFRSGSQPSVQPVR